MMPEIQLWLDNNRKRAHLLHSFRDAAILIARELYDIKNPSEEKLDEIILVLHGKNCC